MWASTRSSPAIRAGRPIMRRCSPIDIIFGAWAPSRHRQSKASITYSAKSALVTKRWRPEWKCMSLVSRLYGITRWRAPPTVVNQGRSSL